MTWPAIGLVVDARDDALLGEGLRLVAATGFDVLGTNEVRISVARTALGSAFSVDQPWQAVAVDGCAPFAVRDTRFPNAQPIAPRP